MTKAATRPVLAAALLSLVASTAHGADMAPLEEAAPAPVPAPSGWIFQVTPYVWAADLEGDVSPFRRLPTVHIEKSFSDIVDDLNFGGFINFWARNDRFVIAGDVMYVNTTESDVFGPVDLGGIIAIPPIDVDVDTALFNATLQAGYRLYDRPQFTFDLLGGARFWHLWTDVNVSALGLSATLENDFGWIDPVIGGRAHVHFNDKLSFLVQGDIGGFGVGSDFSWQALATVNYSFNDRLAVSAGYKVLSVDYDDDGHVFDTTLKGPVLGLTYRF